MSCLPLLNLQIQNVPKTDGISFLPTLLRVENKENHTFMYWELGQQRAVRKDNWKAYRDKKGNWELYDLSSDIEEQIDLAHKKEKVTQGSNRSC